MQIHNAAHNQVNMLYSGLGHFFAWTPTSSPSRNPASFIQSRSAVPVSYKRFVGTILLVCFWLVAESGIAQTVPFQIIGHIQSFTLTTPANVLSSATITVNGITVVIPTNTVVVMPAAYLTPRQIFTSAPPGTPAGRSGLALDDRGTLADPPLAAFEATLEGNIVGGVYIAGLVHISQQSLNNSAGFIRNITYTTAELCVGATPTPVATCVPPDTRVRINDPSQVYGANNTSPDPRFSVDPENPTIHAQTGYPMCVPNVAPPAIDANCPSANRPLTGSVALTTFVMSGPDIPSSALPPGQLPIVSCKSPLPACDPDKQAPFMVGDFITFSGTLFKDGNATHPFFVSAHTIEANVGIYTRLGSGNTVYIFQEKTLLGTQGPFTAGTCVATLECTAKLKIVGFITDPTRAALVGIYAIDVHPVTGVRTSRKLAVSQKLQAPFGRFRYEIAKAPALLPNGLGATRELMVRIDDPAPLADGTVIPTITNSPGLVKAHGLIAGQYIAPVGEYLFPEGLVMGSPPPPANFQCLAFLTAGWTTPGIPPLGQLAPWPGAVAPPASAAGIRCNN